MPSVFISYRRDSAGAVAGRLRDRLVSEYGPSSVFIDVDTIKPGDDFRKVISDAVGGSDVLLAVIDDRWNPHIKAAGGSESVLRLDSEDDFVRIEVASALAQGVRVVPVLYKKAQLPTDDELPADLQGLTTRQAVRVTDETWDSDVGRLIDALRPVASGRSKANARSPRESDAPVAAERKTLSRLARAGMQSRTGRTARATFLIVVGTFNTLSGAALLWLGLNSFAQGGGPYWLEWSLFFSIPGAVLLIGGIAMLRSIRSDRAERN